MILDEQGLVNYGLSISGCINNLGFIDPLWSGYNHNGVQVKIKRFIGLHGNIFWIQLITWVGLD